jgi:hypothetical protein
MNCHAKSLADSRYTNTPNTLQHVSNTGITTPNTLQHVSNTGITTALDLYPQEVARCCILSYIAMSLVTARHRHGLRSTAVNCSWWPDTVCEVQLVA